MECIPKNVQNLEMNLSSFWMKINSIIFYQPILYKLTTSFLISHISGFIYIIPIFKGF